MPEDVQELGRRGVADLKRWLEATTYMELPFDAYNHSIDCTVQTMATPKQFDLAGYMLEKTKSPVIVEAKNYSSAGRQYEEFRKFQAIAYSHAVHEIETFKKSRKPIFLWVTFHPFAVTKWNSLESVSHLKDSLASYPDFLAERPIDDEIAASVAKRISILVFNKRQKKWSLTRTELELIRHKLDRKGRTL
ncbi:hypothetical protein [Pseudoclavibacter sp. RFBA6]|uniref:hypothetical protein n=1 Tax=Pseudoclavibacter sp. RFBA6 TaxID=2080573 RepID=UPI000D4B8E74|nr:hypothetical protein [Pseudoclavibacter sp. RFBA6]PPG39451.1 hypothetical protein C5C17_11705 [Pseudoclavibacter sp. RFBA6]